MSNDLTDPQLEMLRELLTHEPGNPVFVEVARELIRRRLLAEAISMLEHGLEHRKDSREGWEMLAKVAVEQQEYLRALLAFETLSPTPDRHPELVKLQIQALVGIGQIRKATGLAESLVLLHPELGPLEVLVQQQDAPDPNLSGPDPYLTVRYAEQFADMGRPDRAIRIYRRLLFHHPNKTSLRARLLELLALPSLTQDDLSEELPPPSTLQSSEEILERDDSAITMPAINVSMIRRRVAEANRTLPGTEEIRRALLDDVTGEEVSEKVMERAKSLPMIALDEEIREIRRR